MAPALTHSCRVLHRICALALESRHGNSSLVSWPLLREGTSGPLPCTFSLALFPPHGNCSALCYRSSEVPEAVSPLHVTRFLCGAGWTHQVCSWGRARLWEPDQQLSHPSDRSCRDSVGNPSPWWVSLLPRPLALPPVSEWVFLWLRARCVCRWVCGACRGVSLQHGNFHSPPRKIL